MADQKHYRRNEDFIFRKIVDETVLIPIHKDIADMDCIYTLNDVGAFIWEQLGNPQTQTELQAAVLDAYAAEPDVVLAELQTFLDEMSDIGAILEA